MGAVCAYLSLISESQHYGGSLCSSRSRNLISESRNLISESRISSEIVGFFYFLQFFLEMLTVSYLRARSHKQRVNTCQIAKTIQPLGFYFIQKNIQKNIMKTKNLVLKHPEEKCEN